MSAPFADPLWAIWACSPANVAKKLPRIDLWFEMHSFSLEEKKVKNPPYYAWLKRQPNVVMQQKDPDFPGSKPYPLEMVRKRWPWGARYFLTSSPALMMAAALLTEPECLGLWGIDMAGQSEWAWQRPGCHYWLEQADKQGCHIITPGEADILCPPPLYGFCESTHMWRKLHAREVELRQRVAACEHEAQAKQHEMLILKGALESTQYEIRTWLPDHVDPRQVQPEGGEQVVLAPETPKQAAKRQRAGLATRQQAELARVRGKRNSAIRAGKPVNGKAEENQATVGAGDGGQHRPPLTPETNA